MVVVHLYGFGADTAAARACLTIALRIGLSNDTGLQKEIRFVDHHLSLVNDLDGQDYTLIEIESSSDQDGARVFKCISHMDRHPAVVLKISYPAWAAAK